MFCVVASFPNSDRFRPEYDAPCFLRKMTDAPDLSSGASKAIFFWRHHPESNRGIKVLQTSALPLGYGAEKNGAGYEARTRYLHLGKVALYQMSYGRIFGAFILAPSRFLTGPPQKFAKQMFVGKRRKSGVHHSSLACKTAR